MRRIESATDKGLREAALGVEGAAKRRVPVEYGNLRASGYSRKHPMKRLTYEVSFIAAYAFYVHENIEMKWRGQPRKSGIGVYWGPQGEAKFLEKALMENIDAIRRVIADNLRRELSR